MSGLCIVLKDEEVNSILSAVGQKQNKTHLSAKQTRHRHNQATTTLKKWEDDGVPEKEWNFLKKSNSKFLEKYDLNLFVKPTKQCSTPLKNGKHAVLYNYVLTNNYRKCHFNNMILWFLVSKDMGCDNNREPDGLSSEEGNGIVGNTDLDSTSFSNSENNCLPDNSKAQHTDVHGE